MKTANARSSAAWALASAVIGGSFSQTLLAQEGARDSQGIEEIVVTATKREVRLLDVPLSVSVLTADQVANAGATTVADLAYAVPGLTAINTASNQQQYFIRGIASGSGLPTVGTYLDEVATGSRNAAQSTDVRPVDIERIEVLRGPQGTLFGEGSMGGTIRIITRKPQLDAFGFGLDAEYYGTDGGDASTSVSAVANLPVVKDKFALRLVGMAQDSGGWIDETVLGRKDANKADTKLGRLKGLWAPTEGLQIAFMLLKQEVEGDGLNAGTAEGTIATPIAQPFSDEYELYNLTVDADLGVTQFLSSTALVERDNLLVISLAGFADAFNPPAPSPPFFKGAMLASSVGSKDFSQEFRLSSNTDGRWSWTAGAFYREFEYFGDQPIELTVVSALPDFIPDLTLLTTFAPSTSESKAVFGESSWRLTERLEATVGLRWYEDEQRQVITTASPGLPDNTTDGEGTFDALTSRFNLAYRFSANRMIYFNAAQGFRSGGFNTSLAPAGVTVPPDYDAEDLWTYEVGTKLVGAQGKLVFEGAVFHNDWKDIQSLFTPFAGATISVTTNGGKASGTGFDWNLIYRPMPALSLAFTGSYIDAKYDVTTLDKRKDDPIDFVAELAWAVSTDYNFDLSVVPAYLNLSYQYQDRLPYTALSTGADTTYSDELRFLNARIGARFKGLNLYLFGRNLTNENGNIDPFTDNPFRSARSRPRQIGIGVSVPVR